MMLRRRRRSDRRRLGSGEVRCCGFVGWLVGDGCCEEMAVFFSESTELWEEGGLRRCLDDHVISSQNLTEF